MPTPDKEIWFPAKLYGLGWGLPCAWQGWAALGGWLALVVASTPLVLVSPLLFSAIVLGLTAVLMVICWRKGEKVRWRWGKD